MLPGHVYHLAEAANWPRIRREGLLSASRLLDQAELAPAERFRLDQKQRLAHTCLPTGAWIRDQKPLPEAALCKCLVGMEPAEWYTLINSWVFFWLDPDRLNRQRAACAPRPQVVLTIDASGLVRAHQDRVCLTPINTGNARRAAARRGRSTFVPYRVWAESRWASEASSLGMRERSRSHAPVELTVWDAVPDLMQFVVAVSDLEPGQSFVAPG